MKWARACALAAFAVLGCGPSRLPDPSIDAISPTEIERGHAPQVRLDVTAVYPFAADYGAGTGQVNSAVTVRIGGNPLAGTAVQPDGAITGVVPFALPPATHDVVLELADGRMATLPGGFTVKAGIFPDAFTIDPVADQRRDQPFTITVRAVGGRAAEFSGVVQLAVNKGTLMPALSAPFDRGVLTQSVTIPSTNFNVVLTVTDAEGHTGSSNAFRVAN